MNTVTFTLYVMLLWHGPRLQAVENYPDYWSCLEAAERWGRSLPEHKPENKKFFCKEVKKGTR